MNQSLGGADVLCPCLPAPPSGRLELVLVLALELVLGPVLGPASLLEEVVLASAASRGLTCVSIKRSISSSRCGQYAGSPARGHDA